MELHCFVASKESVEKPKSKHKNTTPASIYQALDRLSVLFILSLCAPQ